MPQPEWDDLSHEVQDLRARVARIENLLGLTAAESPQAVQGHESAAVALVDSPAALLPILGRALLGLAGAYLLRALTESGTLAPRMGVAAGLIYAMTWLVWAARTPAARRLETAIHGLTSALVISPLLYESTVRFHAISTWTAVALLFVFTVFGFAVSWRKDLLIVATFATLAGLGTGAALLLSAHDALPVTFLFLAIAATVEICACLNHWLSERWLTAAAADLAVLFTTWLVTNERGIPETYVGISHSALLVAQIALLAIYLSSIIVRTLLRGFTFTGFETAQCAIAFAISVGGGLSMTPALAIVALACSAACYLVAFLMLDREGTHRRNFYTYSTFAILLAIAGSRILLTGPAAAATWSLLAIAAVWVGGVLNRLTLQVHGGIFLLFALASSNAIEQASALLLGQRAWPTDLTQQWPLWAGLAAAGVCYSLRAVAAGTWSSRILRTGEAATLTWLVAGIAAGLLTYTYHTTFGASATHAYCATLRTTVLSGSALVLARTRRIELVYPIMGLGAYRMIFTDLRQDRTIALFLSLLVYGAALMILPRLKKATDAMVAGS